MLPSAGAGRFSLWKSEWCNSTGSGVDAIFYLIINEAVEKKYAFTPEDKYAKLQEKNPLIDLLRATFDLDI